MTGGGGGKPVRGAAAMAPFGTATRTLSRRWRRERRGTSIRLTKDYTDWTDGISDLVARTHAVEVRFRPEAERTERWSPVSTPAISVGVETDAHQPSVSLCANELMPWIPVVRGYGPCRRC